MITEDDINDLNFLVETTIITTEDKNLRSKIDSLNRSLDNLEAKRARIDYEIKRQKKSLFRKREELKKVSKRNSKQVSLKLESVDQDHTPTDSEISWLSKLDSKLLQESNLRLEREVRF